jgi:hypothetical protein
VARLAHYAFKAARVERKKGINERMAGTELEGNEGEP